MDKYSITKKVIWEIIGSVGVGGRFTYFFLCNEIIEKTGWMRVALGYTVGDYLKHLEGKGILEEDLLTKKKSNEFIVLKTDFT